MPHVVVFTEKKSIPALLKTPLGDFSYPFAVSTARLAPSLRLSIEFKDRAALGVVLTGSEDWLRESKKR